MTLDYFNAITVTVTPQSVLWKCTVNPVLSRHSKRRPKICLQDRLLLNAGQKYCRMLQESILQYFWPSLSYHLSLISLFCLFLNGRLRQVLLYTKKRTICRLIFFFPNICNKYHFLMSWPIFFYHTGYHKLYKWERVGLFVFIYVETHDKIVGCCL